jgi:hypothetical protein
VPSHRFLCSWLWFYGLELHHLTPSEILYIMASITLCKVYMGIEPHFDLWNHFFRARLLPGSTAKVVILGGMDMGMDLTLLPVPHALLYGWVAESMVLLKE